MRSVVVPLLLTASVAAATESQRWIVDTSKDFLEGRGDGVAVTVDGRLKAVAGWGLGTAFEEPYVVAGGRLKDGSLIIGTGHPARLYRIDGDTKKLLTEVPGEQVSSILVTPDDDVYVASVPPGTLHRWRGGRLEEVARLGEGGIWDMALVDSRVVVATGTPATLYRLGPQGLERWLELPDAHARCLAVSEGVVLVGTSGKGLIFGVRPPGQISLLADSPFTEISDLVPTPDGSVWATALVGEPEQEKAKAGAKDATAKASTGTIELDLPKVNGTTATSELLRLTPDGALLSVHRFTKQIASAIAWDGEGVLVGTGYEGEVWRFIDGGGARLTTVDAVQVVGLLDGGDVLVTQAPGQVLRRLEAGERPARFRIQAKRLDRPVRFGEYRLSPAGGSVKIRFRSGASEKPDDSWLPWTEWLSPPTGSIPMPPGRSLQWELELDDDAVVERVEAAYREINLAPKIESVAVEDPGEIYLSGPPPSGPVIERAHPDVSGVFSVIDENGGKQQAKNTKGKKYWRVGFRTVSWEASDPNDEPLRFDLVMERRDGFRLPVRERIDGTQLALDTTAVPDGDYRFELVATDEIGNPGDPLEARSYSRWFVVDNTPPVVNLERRGGKWLVTVRDQLSPVAQVEWSRDGDRWRSLAPIDGVLDGTTETFEFDAGEGHHLVVVRAIDHQHNRATADGIEN